MTAPLELLAKALRQTESPIDGEALAALRASQMLMRRNGWTWDSLLRGEAAPIEEDPATKEIRDAFETLDASVVDASFMQFIASLKTQFERNGVLSVKQTKVLLDSARKAKLGGRR